MSTPSKIILIACGSFSPPTPMHLRMFEIAKDYFTQMGTHQVIGGIVSPVHDSYGKNGLLPAKHRCSMVKLALQSSDWIRMSNWEVEQEQWSRTRLTLQYHQNYINSFLNDIHGTTNEILPHWLPDGLSKLSGNVQIKLLCGADLLESFSVPGLWKTDDLEAILGQHGIVVISRSGTNPEQFIFNSDLLSRYRRNITIITNWVANEVSSTVVRRLMSRGESVKYLLDDFVIDYIKKHGLYGINDNKYVLTPNQNEISFFTTPSSTYSNGLVLNLNKLNRSRDFEDMDDTDSSSKKSLFSADSNDMVRSKVFCCGDTLNMKSLTNHPGQAVQILTDSSGTHTFQRDEVGDNSICTISAPSSNHVETVEVNAPSSTCNNDLTTSTSTRSYNDMIKFVFTEHGIRVISDKEYVV